MTTQSQEMNFDVDGLKALVWVYATQEGIITPGTWEKIICKSLNGDHIPGDIFMADGKKNKFGLNIKSLLKNFTKGNFQTCSFVQCRCPLDNEINVGEGVIKTLTNKRKESFDHFDLTNMIDVIVLHNRINDNYNIRVFCHEQCKYENLNLKWYNGLGYLNENEMPKNWKLKRVPGNSSAFQTCVFVKEVFDFKNCVANFTIRCDNNYDISIQEAKERYAKIQQK